MKKRPKVTIGIPTCYGAQSLLQTVKSVLSFTKEKIKLIIVADTTPISQEILIKLKRWDVKVIWNKQPSSQAKKIKQLIKLCNTEIFIFTNDDVSFTPTTISEILKTFKESPELTMVSACALPKQAKTLFESIIQVGVHLSNFIGKKWRNGDNYLLASGRCLAFRTDFVKKFIIHEESINNDTYLYFENKRLDGLFSQAKDSLVYYKSPSYLKEHLNQTSRFQYSQEEMSRYFNTDLSQEYQTPLKIIFYGCWQEFLRNPIYMSLYLCVFIYSRIFAHRFNIRNSVWDIDISTKE